MTTQALLETLPNRRYRVTGSGRFAVYGEGNTPDEAIAAFRQATRQAQVITVDLADDVQQTILPPAEISDETWNDFLEEIERQRQTDNAVHFVGSDAL
ncbi:MAG: hypothetical protein SFU56_13485 [Capsulimonadales bacterium]|nr:hypothetical protein [Capsulimonadales bacterium]